MTKQVPSKDKKLSEENTVCTKHQMNLEQKSSSSDEKKDDPIVISENFVSTRVTGNESSSDMLTPSMGQTQDFSMSLDPSRNIPGNGTGIGIVNDSEIISTDNSVMKTKVVNDVSLISGKTVFSENSKLKHCESDDEPDDLVNLDKSTINELKVSTCFLF